MNPIVKSSPKHVLEFTFPLPRPLTGIALGNGAQGLLIWGEDTLNITIARNGFWDHRGMSKHHKILADIGLEKVLKIKKTSDNASLPPKAYQLGGARLVLHFPDGLVPERAIWCLEAGKIVIILSNKAGRSEELRLWQAPDQEAAFIELPEGLVTETRMELIPAWKWIGSQLEKWGITPPCVESPETAEKLPIVAELLGEDIDGRWAEVAEKLPFSKEIDTQSDLARSGPSIRNITAQTSDRRIGIWEDEDYSESHRHHSHLAAFYPFETLDPFDTELSEVAENTYNTWTFRGTGFWAGWSFPWASILCSRYNRPTAAVSMLHQLETGYTNEGGNTGHDGAPGISVGKWRSAEFAEWNWRADEGRATRCSTEIIQMDAALGAVSAVLELLVQARPDGIIYVLPALPPSWYELRFDNIGCPGGFRIGATVENRKTTEIRIQAMRQGSLRVAHGMGNAVEFNGQVRSGNVIDLTFEEGERVVIRTYYTYSAVSITN